MKIGILTFHYSNNYGGVLQCYSLYKVIEKLATNVEVINFIPKNGNVKRELIRKSILEDKNIRKLCIRIKKIDNLKKNFEAFRINNMKLSEKINEDELEEFIKKNYNLVIVGSDQVWNPSQRKKNEYFLNYNKLENVRKISYAADSTISEVKVEEIEFLKKALRRFEFISVRNKHSYEFVGNVIREKKIEEVVDPTALIDFEEENKFVCNDEEYILVYTLGEEIEGTNEEAIKKIKEKTGIKKVYQIIMLENKFEILKCANNVFYDIGPNEWVELIKKSTFVFTDSFHGVMFAMKFQKLFIAYYSEELRASRFISLSKKYGLENNIYTNIREMKIDKIDYDKINKIMDSDKENSLKFLIKALNLQE